MSSDMLLIVLRPTQSTREPSTPSANSQVEIAAFSMKLGLLSLNLVSVGGLACGVAAERVYCHQTSIRPDVLDVDHC